MSTQLSTPNLSPKRLSIFVLLITLNNVNLVVLRTNPLPPSHSPSSSLHKIINKFEPRRINLINLGTERPSAGLVDPRVLRLFSDVLDVH